MKIDCEVIEAKCNGETVSLILQGQNKRPAFWRPYLKFAIELPEHKKVTRTYFLGRKVSIEVKPI